MKKSIAIISFLLISVSLVWAQRSTVRLISLREKPTIVYTAKEVVIKFSKQDFLNMYASMEKGVWVERNAQEYKAATTSIEWLKKQSKLVQLDENMTDQSKPESALAWLVKNLVGAPLIVKGEAELYELNGKKKNEIIEVNVEESELSGKSYTFFNPSYSIGFLKIWNLNEWVPFTAEVAAMDVEVATVEVVFEEPKEKVAENDPSKVYFVVEQPPEYPGGMGTWNEYVKKSLNYPKDAIKQQIEGTVYVAFVVLENGKLSDFTIIKSVSPSCDKEALRLCQESIDWKPGKQNGKAVKVKFVIPIKFRLADLEKK